MRAAATNTPDASEPFAIDPDKLDRATRAHADLQNVLAERLEALGVEPLSPAVPHDPEFDIAWRASGTIHVCEVKTTTLTNRDRQLRLALGQVLHYAKQLELRGERVRALVLTPTSAARSADVWEDVMRDARVAWLTESVIDGPEEAARAALLGRG